MLPDGQEVRLDAVVVINCDAVIADELNGAIRSPWARWQLHHRLGQQMSERSAQLLRRITGQTTPGIEPEVARWRATRQSRRTSNDQIARAVSLHAAKSPPAEIE